MICAATPEDLDEFCTRVSYVRTPTLKGIKLVRDDVIQAIVGFDYWTPNAAQMHVWVGGQVNRAFIRECFNYLFVTCKKGLAIGVTPSDNKEALDFNRRIGFRVCYEVADGWALGTSMVIQELRKDECIWIRGLSEQADSPRT